MLAIAYARPRIPLPMMALLRLKTDIPKEVFPSNCKNKQGIRNECECMSLNTRQKNLSAYTVSLELFHFLQSSKDLSIRSNYSRSALSVSRRGLDRKAYKVPNIF